MLAQALLGFGTGSSAQGLQVRLDDINIDSLDEFHLRTKVSLVPKVSPAHIVRRQIAIFYFCTCMLDGVYLTLLFKQMHAHTVR